MGGAVAETGEPSLASSLESITMVALVFKLLLLLVVSEPRSLSPEPVLTDLEPGAARLGAGSSRDRPWWSLEFLWLYLVSLNHFFMARLDSLVTCERETSSATMSQTNKK